MHSTKRTAVLLIGFCLLGLTACATVPKEAVQLSYTLGQDIEQLHAGYRQTVKFAFEQIRQRGLRVIDSVWTPTYLKTFVKGGGLVGFAKAEQTERVEFWAHTAIAAIDNKRTEFLEPLQDREDALIAEIDDAFSRVIRANAAVTAHLNSVLKVQDLQADILDAAGLQGVRDRINDAIVGVSDWAEKARSEIEKAAAELESSG